MITQCVIRCVFLTTRVFTVCYVITQCVIRCVIVSPSVFYGSLINVLSGCYLITRVRWYYLRSRRLIVRQLTAPPGIFFPLFFRTTFFQNTHDLHTPTRRIIRNPCVHANLLESNIGSLKSTEYSTFAKKSQFMRKILQPYLLP